MVELVHSSLRLDMDVCIFLVICSRILFNRAIISVVDDMFVNNIKTHVMISSILKCVGPTHSFRYPRKGSVRVRACTYRGKCVVVYVRTS
jgi:hypothetical protein